jgi:hypothetical protein
MNCQAFGTQPPALTIRTGKDTHILVDLLFNVFALGLVESPLQIGYYSLKNALIPVITLFAPESLCDLLAARTVENDSLFLAGQFLKRCVEVNVIMSGERTQKAAIIQDQ